MLVSNIQNLPKFVSNIDIFEPGARWAYRATYCTLDLVFQLKSKTKSYFRGGSWSVHCCRAWLKFSEESKGEKIRVFIVVFIVAEHG